MEDNRDHLPTKGYQHTKFEVQATFTYWDTVFTRFQSLTSGDLKWPLTYVENNRIIYLPRATNIPNLKFRQLSLVELPCLQGFQSLTSNDLWPPLKTLVIIYPPWAVNIPSLKFQQLSFIEITRLQSFRLWPLVTSNDVWPPWKTIGIIYPPSKCHTHTPSPSHRLRQGIKKE